LSYKSTLEVLRKAAIKYGTYREGLRDREKQIFEDGCVFFTTETQWQLRPSEIREWGKCYGKKYDTATTHRQLPVYTGEVSTREQRIKERKERHTREKQDRRRDRRKICVPKEKRKKGYRAISSSNHIIPSLDSSSSSSLLPLLLQTLL
jgi:hypothetical protein